MSDNAYSQLDTETPTGKSLKGKRNPIEHTATRVTLIICGIALVAAFALVMILSLTGVTLVTNALSPAYAVYKPFNLTMATAANCSVQDPAIRSIIIGWTALLIPGAIMLFMGITWKSGMLVKLAYGHARARWLYSFVGIMLSVWFTQIHIGTVQILEWILTFAVILAITTTDWIMCEVNSVSMSHYKSSKKNDNTESGVVIRPAFVYKLKGAFWLEAILALFVLAQLATSFGVMANDATIETIAVWVKVLFGFQLATFILYIVSNGIFQLSNVVGNMLSQELVNAIIVTVMCLSVVLTGFAGQYMALNP